MAATHVAIAERDATRRDLGLSPTVLNDGLFAERESLRRRLDLLPANAGELDADKGEVDQLRSRMADVCGALYGANYGIALTFVGPFAEHKSALEQQQLRKAAAAGLAEAIETFDPTRGTRFTSWLYPMIQRRVLKVAGKQRDRRATTS